MTSSRIETKSGAPTGLALSWESKGDEKVADKLAEKIAVAIRDTGIVEEGEGNLKEWQESQPKPPSPESAMHYSPKSPGQRVRVKDAEPETTPSSSAPTSKPENTEPSDGTLKTPHVSALDAIGISTTTPTTSGNGLIRNMALSAVRILMGFSRSVNLFLFRTFKKLNKH